MKIFAALAAAGFMLAAPAMTLTASASPVMSDAVEQTIQLTPGMQLAQVRVQIGDDRRGRRMDRRHMHRGHMHRGARVCTTRTMFRDGRRVTVRSCR